MIAEFAATEASDCGPLPIRSSERVSASSSAARVAASSASGRPPGDELDEPVEIALAVPEVSLDLLEERGSEAAQALLRTELEDAVGLQPGGLCALPVTRGRGGLEAVQRCGDHVEVGRLRGLLPLLRIERPDESEGVLRRGLDVLRCGDDIASRGICEIRLEGVEVSPETACARPVDREERREQVHVGGLRSVTEGDCLLDLEVERHAPVRDAAAVFDGDEPQEALELARATDELLLREGSGTKTLESSLDVSHCCAVEAAVGGRSGDRRERARHPARICLSSLSAIGTLDQRPVPEREGAELSRTRGVAELPRIPEIRQRRSEAVVIGVEQVVAHERCGPPRGDRVRFELGRAQWWHRRSRARSASEDGTLGRAASSERLPRRPVASPASPP